MPTTTPRASSASRSPTRRRCASSTSPTASSARPPSRSAARRARSAPSAWWWRRGGSRPTSAGWRGTGGGAPANRGLMLRKLLDHKAQPVGNPREFHAVAVDARAPKFDGGIVTRLDSLPFGIVVNRDARRFYDEGEDFWPKRYAIWGGLIARQPGQVAYSIGDARAVGRFMPSAFPAVEGGPARR